MLLAGIPDHKFYIRGSDLEQLAIEDGEEEYR